MKKILLSLSFVLSLFGEDLDDLLDGFDDKSSSKPKEKKQKITKEDELLSGFDEETSDNHFDDKEVADKTVQPKNNFFQDIGLEGKITESFAYSYQNDSPHNDLSMAKSSLFLELNKEIWDDFKLKINGVAFYDLAYTFKGRDKFSQEDLDDLESEVELYDAYIQTSLSQNLDLKLGRQVVVWGKSDTIRIVDSINALDNRRPGMTDIEDLRLPSAMVKLDYYYKNWRVTPIAIIEQRFNKNPPFGGDFYPSPQKPPKQDKPHSATFALNVGGEFEGFDLDFYLCLLYPQDELGLPMVDRSSKVDMAGVALNYVYHSWLFKSELAYKKDLKFLQSGDRDFDRFDSLVGFEYNGIADTKISFDVANRHMDKKSQIFEQDSYQYALRASSDFLNSTLHANYLISLFGKKLDEGGFQRAWLKYDIADGVGTNFGVVDYIGGSPLLDAISDNDMIFLDVSYSF